MKKPIMVDQLLQRIQTFPALPMAVTRLIRLTAGPGASIEEIKRLIEADSSLALEILKWANSPLFGHRREVTTLDYAISLLGMAEITNLVLAKTMFQTFRTPTDVDTTSFWRHSFYCGLAARIVARGSGFVLESDGDEYFTAGLIHDIGKLLIYMELDAEKVKILDHKRPLNPELIRDEETVSGIGHDQLGMRLLKRWTFPEVLVMAVGYHHRPEDAPEAKRFPLVVRIADILAHIYEAEEKGSPNDREHLEQMLMKPETCHLAQRLGVQLNSASIEVFLQELRTAIANEAEIIELLTADGE